MNGEINLYHLHKNNKSGFHFEVKDGREYTSKNTKHCYQPHRHSFYQIIWFTQEGKHHIDYKTFYHEADTLFFINVGQVHHFCADSSNAGFLFHFNDVFLNRKGEQLQSWLEYQLFTEIESPMIQMDEREEKTQLVALRELITQELDSTAYNYQSQVYHLFQAFITYIERIKRSSISDSFTQSPDIHLITNFKELINKNLEHSYTLEFYSRELGISSKKLTQISKLILGDTPSNIITQRKILEAKRLLSNTHLSIKEVGYQLGFDQATYFTKTFKKIEGISPKEFLTTVG